MFERFATEARDAVLRARCEADALRHPAIGVAHLILACAASSGPAARALDGSGLAPDAVRLNLIAVTEAQARRPDADALRTIGIDLDEVRSHVERTFGRGALDRTRAVRGRRGGPGLPFTPKAKRSLDLALRSAIRLGHRYVGPEHIVLGALDADDATLQAVLARCGTSAEAVRMRLGTALGERATGT